MEARFPMMVYADDIALIAGDVETMERKTIQANRLMKKYGLEVNAAKSRFIEWRHGKGMSKDMTVYFDEEIFKVYASPETDYLSIKLRGEPDEYLQDSSRQDILSEIKRMRKITKEVLPPACRMEWIKISLIPRLAQWHVKEGSPVDAVKDDSDLIIQVIRDMMNHQQISKALLALDTNQGGLGVGDLVISVLAERTRLLMKAISDEGRTGKAIKKLLMTAAEAEPSIGRSNTSDSLFGMINGHRKMPISGKGWQFIRSLVEASASLKLEWRRTQDKKGKEQWMLYSSMDQRRWKMINATDTSAKIRDNVKNQLMMDEVVDGMKRTSFGIHLVCFQDITLDRLFATEYAFIVHSRSDSFCHKNRGQCNRCSKNGTISHTLQACTPFLEMYAARHDAVSMILLQYLRHSFDKILIDTEMPIDMEKGIYCKQRTDLMCFKEKKVVNIEVGITSTAMIPVIFAHKERKYKEWMSVFNHRNTDWTVTLAIVVIGEEGAWHTKSLSAVRNIIPKKAETVISRITKIVRDYNAILFLSNTEAKKMHILKLEGNDLLKPRMDFNQTSFSYVNRTQQWKDTLKESRAEKGEEDTSQWAKNGRVEMPIISYDQLIKEVKEGDKEDKVSLMIKASLEFPEITEVFQPMTEAQVERHIKALSGKVLPEEEDEETQETPKKSKQVGLEKTSTGKKRKNTSGKGTQKELSSKKARTPTSSKAVENAKKQLF